jgi:DNA-binding transcriptional MerR regulator
MAGRVFRIGQFARAASVSVRTLRYYDAVGLLPPSLHTRAGYRLYRESDLLRLQQVLTLKFLGFSLDEIKVCLRTGPQGLREVLAAQKAMMRERRDQLSTVITAIEETERALDAGCDSWPSIVKTLEALQMQQKQDWHDKYFTPEQRQTMDELSAASYSEEARRKLAARGTWTEEDQQRVDAQYAWIGAELKRLVAAGADPASPEAQAVAQRQRELLTAFTQGDPEVEAGLRRWWQSFNALPRERRPFKAPYSGAEAEFMQKALAALDQK